MRDKTFFAPVKLVAPRNSRTTPDEHKTIARVIRFLRDTSETGLIFQYMDMGSVRLEIASDAFFANEILLRSQMGYVVLLVGAKGVANVVK